MSKKSDISKESQRPKKKHEAEEEKKSFREMAIDEGKFFGGLILFLLLFYTFVFGHYKIPSESMQPTLEVGDHLYVSKMAYGYSKHSVPLGLHKLPLPDGKLFSKLPKRGDVAVFRNPNTGVVMIKRVLGLPGDEIIVLQGRIYLNNELIERTVVDQYTYRADNGPRSMRDRVARKNKGHERWGYKIDITEYSEQWPGEEDPHRIYEETDSEPLDNTRPVTVPAGTIFLVGDNRDRSFDSRADSPNAPGFVPLDHLIGRADRMMFSFKKCSKDEGVRCPPRRFMKKL